MEVEIAKDGQKLNVAVSGRITSDNVRELEAKLKQTLDGITKIVFDFSGLDYLSSSGLRVLLGCSKRVAGNMVIQNTNEMVKDIFKMTGLSSVINVE